MPSNRPPKRLGDPSDSPSGSKMKLPKLEREPEDFSSVVKSKLQSYTRTGQACDRCKVRKIRCDALPQGCSHCTNQNLECFVTDRVTGRTERRGYMQELEREKTEMLNHIRSLEKVLANKGIEVKPFHWSPYGGNYPPGVTFDAVGNPVYDPAHKDQWSLVGSAWVRTSKSTPPPPPPPRIQQYTSYANSSFLESRSIDTHLGVGSDNALLSAIKGTQLSILGATIDVTSFAAPDMDDPPPTVGSVPPMPLYNKSVQAFLQSAMNIHPPPAGVELPPRSDAFEYSEWYFLMVYPFMPILHKPSYLQLLTRIYDDPTFKPTTSELVTVHMVFATIYFQYGVRNREDHEKQTQLNNLSNTHYHWCLGKFFDIALDQTITAVQALTMLGNHMRSFPKPGCAYLVVQYAHVKAVEQNLHKAAKGVASGIITLETQMRSRVWWCVLSLGVTLNGRLGRPMPTILEEFDVPFPLAIPDECLTPQGITDRSRIGQCDFRVGLVGYKIVPLYMEMYTNLYSVRRDPRRHVEVVERLEQQLRLWEEELPDELKPDSGMSSNNHQMFALYAQAFALEFRLCLRHPSACTSTDPQYQADNTRICEETSRKLLQHICALLKLKSLDTTWYQLSVYIAAVFCMLVASWERRYRITPEEVVVLKKEMSLWQGIIEEIGILLGSQSGLCNDVTRIINHTIAWIEADMPRKQPNGSPEAERLPGLQSQSQPSLHHTSPQSQPHPAPQPQPQTQAHPQQQASAPTTNGSTPSDASNQQRNGNDTFYDTAALAYHALAGFGDPASAGTNGTNSTPGTSYDPNESVYPLYAAAPATGTSPTTQGSSTAAQPGPDNNNSNNIIINNSTSTTTNSSTPIGQSTGSTWHDWTSAIADHQDRYSAHALLTLGGAGTGAVGPTHPPPPPQQHQQAQQRVDGTGSAAEMASVAIAPGQQWPLLMFHDTTGTVGGG